MVKTVNLSAEIPLNRELHITLPADIAAGPAEIVLVVSSSVKPDASTLGELADSEFFGMWGERSDIVDSVQFAQYLRSHAWRC
jgi:hypothetical protein